jgi:hypothetical protein
MGAVEEGGKVATGVVDALKGNPVILAVIVLNLVILGMVAWATKEARESFQKTITLMIEKQDKLAQLLYQCTPTPQGNRTNIPGGLHFDLLNNPYLEPLPNKEEQK